MRQKGHATAAVGEATVDCGAALSPHSFLYIVHFSKYFFPICQIWLCHCVCTEIYFSLFSDRYDMDVAQCVEVNTTPARSNWGELH